MYQELVLPSLTEKIGKAKYKNTLGKKPDLTLEVNVEYKSFVKRCKLEKEELTWGQAKVMKEETSEKNMRIIKKNVVG